MKSFELLRAAATLILEGGWAAGGVDAADVEGKPIELWVTGSTETGRAAPNPAAVKFSIYGAIVTALHRDGGRLEDPAAMWALLGKRAAEINNVPHGGDNFVHPIKQFNATQTEVVKVLAFLAMCANEMEIGSGDAGLRPINILPPSEAVRAIPRVTEPKPYPGVALGPHPSQPFEIDPFASERKVNRDPGAVAEPMQIARALKAALEAPQAPLEPHPSQPPAMLREVFDSVLAPNAKPLPPALTTKDVQDLHSTLAVPFREPVLPAGVEITGITPPVLLPYKPMLTTRSLREEHQPALYSGPELNMKGMPNPFGGDNES